MHQDRVDATDGMLRVWLVPWPDHLAWNLRRGSRLPLNRRLEGVRDEIIRTRAYQKFYPHGSSHWIGLNVHDVGSYGYPPGVARLERYGKAEAKLEPGMALTVEPGIYIPERSTSDPKWWHIGVRIEDTVLVTPRGMECLSCGAPREIADVERAIAAGRRKAARKGD